jgi:uncharacterized protein (TIGR02466 family)
MSEVVNLFPLTLYRDAIVIEAEQRIAMIEAILDMAANSSTPRPGRSWTGDVKGYESLHNDPRFAALFARFSDPITKYIEMLGVNREKIEVYYTRSWGTISRGGEKIHLHSHKQSHISLVYYLKKPAGSSGISFMDYDAPNEFAPNIFHESMVRSEILREIQQLNAVTVNLNPSEGDVLLFPSKTTHAIVPNKGDEPRISIAVDIVITVKDSKGLEYLLPSLDTWKAMA